MLRILIRLKPMCLESKLWAHLKVLLLIIAVVMFIKTTRNMAYPIWSHSDDNMNALKIIRINLEDLVYYIDRTPYEGPCQFVHDKMAPYKKTVLEEMPYYDTEDWNRSVDEAKKFMTKQELKMLDSYKPTLTPLEMKQLMYTTAYVSMALMAFNVTHFIVEGSLIGAWRHHFMTPWDDDVDMLFDTSQWPLAKKVLSCLPGIQLDIGSGYMWKAFLITERLVLN